MLVRSSGLGTYYSASTVTYTEPVPSMVVNTFYIIHRHMYAYIFCAYRMDEAQ